LRSLQILKIWGIPFKIHPNWFVLLFLFSWSISNQIILSPNKIYNIQESWLIGFFTSFFLLSSIIFHQIFHTFICLNEGVKIKNITFFFLGAILKTEKECLDALGNIKIALVRPIMCFTTSIFLLFITNLSDSKELILINIISRVSIFNFFLGFLNLLPIGSLDGGTLLKSIIWFISGSKNKGRMVLNKLTFFISLGVLIIGIYFMFNVSVYYGIISSLLGIFGINISKSESQFLKIEEILKEKDIQELKLKPLRRLEFDTNFKEFNNVVKDSKDNNEKFYFITKNGRWEGFLSEQNLKDIPIKKWDKIFIGQHQRNLSDFPTIKENSIPLWKIIEKLEQTNEGILLVVNSLGIPKGLLNRVRIGNYVLKKLGLNISAEIISKIKTTNNYPLGIELPRIIKMMKVKGDI